MSDKLIGFDLQSVLVISGSRDLESSEFKQAAKERLDRGIRHWFKDKEPRDPRNVVFVGDAQDGPDSWVRGILKGMHFDMWVFEGLTGVIQRPGSKGRWISDSSLSRLDTRSRYLARNRQMTSIASVVENVYLLALEHMGSKTKGTANTISAADAVGIGVWHIKYGEAAKSEPAKG